MRTPALLGWIIAFKVVKALSLFALGAALLSTRHMPADALLVEVARTLHVPLSSRMLQRAMAAAISLSPRRELLLAVAAFAYGLLFAVEGVGLSRRAAWARWLTLVATSGLIPLEVYEIARRPTVPRVLVLVVNLGVLVYLVRRKDVFEARAAWRSPKFDSFDPGIDDRRRSTTDRERREDAMSRESRRLAGVILVTVPTVMLGGLTLLMQIVRRAPGYLDNPLRQDLWRAGHAHAGVYLILSLVILRYVDEATLSPSWKWVARLGAPLAAILIPAAFFLSAASPASTEPNGLINLIYPGALALGAAVLTLGVGLLRTPRPL